MHNSQTDALIIGAGIAGLTLALELAKQGKKSIIVDRQGENDVGGLARYAFGGMALIGTKEQKQNGIVDTPELALKDWYSFADFEQQDIYPKQWAKLYTERCYQDVYCYVKDLGINFLPAVNWVERGLYTPGNSVPRYHVIWGTSLELVNKVMQALTPYLGNEVTLLFHQNATELIKQGDKVTGINVENLKDKSCHSLSASSIVVATGGFTGNLAKVKENWPSHWSPMPKQMLNGTHPDSDGAMHDIVKHHGGVLSHLDKMWNYAAGIPHPKPKFDQHGLSLIPCKSALWLDHTGKRIGPEPLVTGFDTNYLCQKMAEQPAGYAWQVLNWTIACKEFAISGAEHNQMIRDKRFFTFLKETFFGNHRLIKQMQDESDHFIVADTTRELSEKMNALTDSNAIELNSLQETLDNYDAVLSRPSSQWNDDQIRRIEHARQWRADKLRTCKPQPIQASKNGPLIAIKISLISRKSLGGIQTNLDSQVLDNTQQPIKGLYAIGEASGFGGGGACGSRSLEGTFLSGCILTARQAAKHLLNSN